MGAFESKRWSELPPETPQPVDKRISRLQIPDPRSPFGEQRTPIQLESYEESPQNRELNICDPRSPSILIDRTPISLPAAGRNRHEPKARVEETEGELEEMTTESNNQDEAFGTEENAAVGVEPPSPDITQINKIFSEVSMSPASPGAPLSKHDTARLLKKTASPSDLKRKRRLSGRRHSVPQKLFSDKVGPAPRSPLAQRSSGNITEAVKKGNKLSFRAQKTKRPSLQEGLYCDKENASAPLVM